MITIQLEPVIDLFNDGTELFQKHWDEVPMNDHDDIGISIDIDKLKLIESLGLLACMVARDEQNKVIGYFVVHAENPIQHKEHSFASQEVIYVSPELRHTSLGEDLIKKMEDHLKESGINFLHLVVNTNYDWSSLPKKLDYKLSERVYTKRLN